jgi:Leucine-rich repeat (LRR) protein
LSKLRAWKFFSAVMALVLVLQLGFLAGLTVPTVAADPVVTFPDTNMEAAIRVAISKPVGDIHASELAILTTLDANGKGIINLTGLEYCINLTYLNLWDNQISNLAPLAGLTNLTYLNLQSNQISNLTPLVGLTNLTYLNLWSNQINNLAPLVGLTNLTYLGLDNNQINSLAPLAGLTNLTDIQIWSNQISDLAPLSGLTNLSHLGLGINQISSVTPLAGLANLTVVILYANQISDLAPLASLTNLTSLGLGYNQISDLAPLTGLTSLTVLDLSGNQICDLLPLAGLINITQLDIDSNKISDIAPLVSNTGLATGDNVDIRSNPLSPASVNVHVPALQARGVTILWDTAASAVTTDPATNITISSATLNGNLTDKGTASSVNLSFEYGLATTYTNPAIGVPPTISTAPMAFSADIIGLTANTTYHYRAVAVGGEITVYGADMIFTTTEPTPPSNPLIGMSAGAPTSHGSSVVGPATTTQPVQLPNIQIQSASLSATKVSPGTPITVTANIANRGTVNGTTRVKVYVNGEEDSSQGVTVESGGNRPVYFTVSRSQPGTYAVYIGGIGAGSFMVESSSDSDIILWLSMACVLAALIMGAIMIMRRQRSYY